MKLNINEFVPARPHAHVTTGEVIQILREKKGWTQKELARRCGISTSNLSMLENDRIDIGKRRSEQLALAFGIHPAILMFPEYESREIAHAA